MARRNLSIPEEVKLEIRKHISEKYKLALDGYFSANEEEDALTGDLGATLRVKNQKVMVGNNQYERPGEWTWSINYHKFRGRGLGATESKLGADGLFELTLKIGGYTEKKSLLFQSKINWKNDPNLLKETVKLTTWREAAFILNFTATEFEAIEIDTVIASRGKRPNEIITTPLDEFIGTNFLDCLVGDLDLKYNARSRILIWKARNGQIVATKFTIPERISVDIVAPETSYDDHYKYDKEIKNEEIHNYRMDASENDILSLDKIYSNKELKKAWTKQALIYHSDKHTFGDSFLDELMKSQMQEKNEAYETLKSKFKK